MKNKIKERMKQILRRGILFTTLLTLAFPFQAWAKDGGNETEYTYTVTLCSGNQGYFAGTNGITVDNHTTGSSYQIEKESQGEKIKISGLKYGDRVMVQAQSCIQLKEDGKYYIGGIRESGRDNNTVGKSAFVVESDQEYVAAYAIAGNMVAYTVNYQDANGNALADSETFYGSVGDQPVVAFKYFENYRPQAYNLTKTLSSNEAENIFTFVYTADTQSAANNGNNANAGDNANTVNNGNAGNNANAANNGNGANNANDANNDANADNNGGADGNVNIPDEQTPQELVNLDDEETPLANMQQKDEKTKRPAGNMPLLIGVAAAAVAGLVALITFALRRKKMNVKAEALTNGKNKKKKEDNRQNL